MKAQDKIEVAKELTRLAKELISNSSEEEKQIEAFATKEDFLKWLLPKIKKIECHVTIKDNTAKKEVDASKKKKEVKVHENKYKLKMTRNPKTM